MFNAMAPVSEQKFTVPGTYQTLFSSLSVKEKSGLAMQD